MMELFSNDITYAADCRMIDLFYPPRPPKLKVMPRVIHCTDEDRLKKIYKNIRNKVYWKPEYAKPKPKKKRVMTEEQKKRKAAWNKAYRMRNWEHEKERHRQRRAKKAREMEAK